MRMALDGREWLRSATPGYCQVTSSHKSDCSRDSSGAFRLIAATSWLQAFEECNSKCLACTNCNFISISLWAADCSWYSECKAPRTDLEGFFSGPVLRRDDRTASIVVPPAPPQPQSAAAVALQVSGHLTRCHFGALQAHLAQCRARFARCDLFVHTWSTMAPATVHWSGGHKPNANLSTAACLPTLVEALEPRAVLVETQRELPRAAEMAPDGLPIQWVHRTERGAQFAAERLFAYQQNLLGMHRASTMRRDFERSEGVHYALGMRLRPDGLGKGGFSSLDAEADLPPLWGCVRAKAGLSSSSQWSDSGRELVACNPGARLGLQDHGNDNCFFGPTEALDSTLSLAVNNVTAVYADLRRKRLGKLPLHRIDSTVLATAAALVGVELARHRYRPARLSEKGLPSCHFDDMRMLPPCWPQCGEGEQGNPVRQTR